MNKKKNINLAAVIFRFASIPKIDELIKSLQTVMPDLIRHPERIEIDRFRLLPE
jgi:hypothetical protein